MLDLLQFAPWTGHPQDPVSVSTNLWQPFPEDEHLWLEHGSGRRFRKLSKSPTKAPLVPGERALPRRFGRSSISCSLPRCVWALWKHFSSGSSRNHLVTFPG